MVSTLPIMATLVPNQKPIFKFEAHDRMIDQASLVIMAKLTRLISQFSHRYKRNACN